MFTKLKAGLIFNGSAMLESDHVLIINTDGSIEDIVRQEEAGDDIREFDGILSPGFVNAHCHIELSYLKNRIPKHTGLIEFVKLVMANRRKADEEKMSAMETASSEMYHSGIVAVGDICNNSDSILLKKTSKLWWHNFIEISGFIDSTAEQRLESGIAVLKNFKINLPEFPSTITAHAPYSVSKSLFNLLNNETKNEIISVHNQESSAENLLYEKGKGNFLDLYDHLGLDISSFNYTGESSLKTWIRYFTNQQQIILVHNNFISGGDLDSLKERNDIHFCLCPGANLFIENTLPPVNLIKAHTSQIVLGTDSYASNEQLDILAEIRILCNAFPGISLTEILSWATKNGAEALRVGHLYGTLKKGMRPGIVHISNDLSSSELVISPAPRS